MSQRQMLQNQIIDQEKSKIHESYHIKDILKFIEDVDHNVKEELFIFFDIDNTIQAPKEEWENFGSDQWFMKLLRLAFEAAPSKDTEALVLAIYHAVQSHLTTRAVETDTVRIISELQKKNIHVVGLTARDRKIIEPTLKQLKNIGVEFCFKHEDQEQFGLSLQGIENAATFNHGVIFCNGNSKGDCLAAFFDKINRHPKNVIMIDDKDKHLYAVKKVIDSYGGYFDGLRYGHEDKNVAEFDKSEQAMQKANMKILDIYHQLSEEGKSAIQNIYRFQLNKKDHATPEQDEKQIKHGKWF